MEPLIAFVVGFLAAGLAGLAGVEALDGWHPALRVGVAAMFLLTAFAHFFPPLRATLIAMVPPGLPRPALLVTVTGVLEAAGAAGVLIPVRPPGRQVRCCSCWSRCSPRTCRPPGAGCRTPTAWGPVQRFRRSSSRRRPWSSSDGAQVREHGLPLPGHVGTESAVR
ncbi:hypothetical protein GCM10010353_36770 [Streptomyces chryseus]|nr:hypothetical protein GCM10010353_36770 [Streptomyces chryseus]